MTWEDNEIALQSHGTWGLTLSETDIVTNTHSVADLPEART